MFAGFRRFQKWIWLGAIIVVIPSFVLFFTPKGDFPMLGGGGGGNFGTVNGRVISREEYLAARKEAVLSFFLRFGEWPTRLDIMQRVGFNLEQEIYTRILLVEKLQEWNIRIDPASTAQWVRENLMDSSGRIFGRTFDRFVSEILSEGGVSADDLERFARNAVGIRRLGTLLGVGGRLVPPQEAEALYRQENEEVSTEVVFFHASNFVAKVSLADDALRRFYTNRLANYRLPERVQVNYIKFEATNHLAEADQKLAQTTNLNQVLEISYLQRGGTNFYTDDKGQPLSFEQAKDRVREEERLRLAVLAARREASEFATVLLDMEPMKVANLEALAKERGRTVGTTEPFDRAGPLELKVGSAFVQAAFALTAVDPIAQMTIPAEDGVYVIALKERLPSQEQPFEAVREKVVTDYQGSESEELARVAAEGFHQALTNSLAQGKGFSVVCADMRVTPQALPPFSASTQFIEGLGDSVSLRQLQNIALDLAPGKASGVVPIRSGSMVLYVRSRLPVSETKLKEELPAFAARLRQVRSGQAFEEWLQQQFQTGALTVPRDREESM